LINNTLDLTSQAIPKSLGPTKYQTEYDYDGIHHKVTRELTSDSEITDVSEPSQSLPIAFAFWYAKTVVWVGNHVDMSTVRCAF